jgi:hypothetical protein
VVAPPKGGWPAALASFPTKKVPAFGAADSKCLAELNATGNAASTRIADYLEEQRQRRDRVVREISARRKTLYVVRGRAAACRLRSRGVMATTVSDLEAFSTGSTGDTIADSYALILILVNRAMLLDWATYEPSSQVHGWWCQPELESWIVANGGDFCRIGLLYYPAAYASPLHRSRIEELTGPNNSNLHILNAGKPLTADAVALGFLSNAFSRMKSIKGLIRPLARFCLRVGPHFQRKVYQRCLHQHGVPSDQFIRTLKRERAALVRLKDEELARMALVA